MTYTRRRKRPTTSSVGIFPPLLLLLSTGVDCVPDAENTTLAATTTLLTTTATAPAAEVSPKFCPVDILECPDGKYVGRNSKKNCAFDSCTENIVTMNTDARDPECETEPFSRKVGAGCKTSVFNICQGGRLIQTKDCPAGLFFNGKKCDIEARLNCEPDPECKSEPNSISVKAGTGCKKYVFCKDGILSNTLTCPDGLLFGGTYCEPAELVTCASDGSTTAGTTAEPASANIAAMNASATTNAAMPAELYCKAKPNSFSAKAGTGCKDYVYCENGNVLYTVSCPGGTLFNGMWCESAENVICTSDSTTKATTTSMSTAATSAPIAETTDANMSPMMTSAATTNTATTTTAATAITTSDATTTSTTTTAKIDYCQTKPNSFSAKAGTGCKDYVYCENGNGKNCDARHGLCRRPWQSVAHSGATSVIITS
ncbi:hypothetical protein ACHAXA_010663 [Cyclostephanos tholiformis]|uniref:Chitin-binding type-2 domain-containing protein n=1 Tax=Cyclostephanos tholiformis TaxID=382380 RepID=A0ABD3RSW6_9STRA